jgi:hypothetical protein
MVNTIRTRTSPPATPPAMAAVGTECLGQSARVCAVDLRSSWRSQMGGGWELDSA